VTNYVDKKILYIIQWNFVAQMTTPLRDKRKMHPRIE